MPTIEERAEMLDRAWADKLRTGGDWAKYLRSLTYGPVVDGYQTVTAPVSGVKDVATYLVPVTDDDSEWIPFKLLGAGDDNDQGEGLAVRLPTTRPSDLERMRVLAAAPEWAWPYPPGGSPEPISDWLEQYPLVADGDDGVRQQRQRCRGITRREAGHGLLGRGRLLLIRG